MNPPDIAPLREPPAGTSLAVLRDVLAIPGSYCLYDRDGVRIDSTVTWTAGRRRGPTPDRVEPPRDVTTVTQPVVFGGLFPKAHFGHVLLELFTRLWPYDAHHADASTPIVHFTHYRRRLEPFEQQLLDAAFDPPRPPRIAVDRPLLLREVLVPAQAIILGQPMHDAVLPLYDRIRRTLAGPSHPDAVPVYLSRSRLADDRRLTLGERRLEGLLANRGVRIVHPQELPLEEQIRIVAGASTVIGLAGSALHLTVFRDLPEATTVSLDPRAPFTIQADVDALRGSRFLHLRAQLPLHPRLPGGRAVEVGRYRNALLPRWTADRILRAIE